MYVIPKATICANLEASGFPCDSMPDAITSRLLATSLRADFYVDGTVTKAATGYKSDARLVLARDNSMVQPLPSITGEQARRRRLADLQGDSRRPQAAS